MLGCLFGTRQRSTDAAREAKDYYSYMDETVWCNEARGWITRREQADRQARRHEAKLAGYRWQEHRDRYAPRHDLQMRRARKVKTC